jgi:hypothetical protein
VIINLKLIILKYDIFIINFYRNVLISLPLKIVIILKNIYN